MLKHHLIFIAAMFLFKTSFSQIYSTKKGVVAFYSQAPIEDIDAHNNNMGVALNTANNELDCVVLIPLFEFKKAKMQRDFNQNYLESEQYPQSTFKGKINENIDFTKEGTYHVTVSGRLKIHGVEQMRTEKGILTVKGNTISIESAFKIRVKDFNVRIPRLLSKNIAEIVDVTVKADLKPVEKPVSPLGSIMLQ